MHVIPLIGTAQHQAALGAIKLQPATATRAGHGAQGQLGRQGPAGVWAPARQQLQLQQGRIGRIYLCLTAAIGQGPFVYCHRQLGLELLHRTHQPLEQIKGMAAQGTQYAAPFCLLGIPVPGSIWVTAAAH